MAALTGKEKSPGKAAKWSTVAVSASEGVAVTKKVASSTVAGTGAGTGAGVAAVAASSSSWSSSVSGTGGGIVKLPASKLMGLKIPDKSAAKEGTFRDRGETSKPPQEGEDVVDIVWMDGFCLPFDTELVDSLLPPSLTHSLTYSLTHSLTHCFLNSLTYCFLDSLSH